MDENKRKKLHTIGFKIQDTCGQCKHGVFPNDDWGTCAINTYEHLKHTGEARQLSIHRYGHCPKFEADPVKVAGLAKFVEYRK